MKVRILTDVSDRTGVHKAGDEVDVPDERGAEYVKTGIAEELGTPRIGEAHPQPPPTEGAAEGGPRGRPKV